ncbi:MAG: ORF6N domain-containing protein [Desulfosporosinus sp.]
MSNLIPVEYQNQRILTTAQLAESYEADAQLIVNNFNRNKERYAEGKHYFVIEGTALKGFRAKNQIDLPPNINKLYLWTEKGAWLHAKSLNNDKAWDAYEMLVDEYYRIIDSSNHKSLAEPSLKKLLALVKTKREFFLLSGLSKPLAYSKALASVEMESGVDLSEFKPVTITGKNAQLDLSPILDAIRAVVSGTTGVYRNFGGGAYALNRDKVYVELDARGLSRKNSLAALWSAGFLERGGVHFTRHFRVPRGRTVRAVFVRVDGFSDREVETVQGEYLN